MVKGASSIIFFFRSPLLKVFLGSTAGRKKRNRHLSNTGRIAAACALLAGYARQDLMDHIDITEVRELGGEVSLKTLNISIPFTSSSSPRNDSDGGTNGDSKTIGLSTSATTWLTKPVLDPWRICLCPIKRWVPDMQVTNCMAHECNVAFTMFNRRHHCRLCGRIFCFACCSNTVRVPSGPHLAASHYAGADNARGVDRMPLPNGEAVAREAGGRDDSLDQNKQNQPQQVDYTTMTAYRICTSCHYEIQLVIPRRDCNGEVRRKCRGELKMLQRLLLVRIVSYLSMEDLLKVSLVSSDFYFVSRDNVIWYRYNMTRCVREEEVQRMLTMTVESPNSTRKWRSTGKITRELSFNTDFDSITSADAAKPAISLHARYNFTQFLDFTRRREATRCKGLSCFSVSTRTLLSSPIKIALIGPSGVGKTMLMREWVQGGRPDTDGTSYEASVPAVPFNRFEEVVHLSGGLTADARLQVFDISGHPCFEELCRFICARCHIVVLCYDPRRRSSFVEAQEMMAKVDSALGAQPVVVCGISPPVSRNRGAVEFEVTKEEARAASTRERGSVQCSWAKSEVLFESVVQCLLDRIALGTSALPFSPSVRSSGEYVTHEEPLANRTVAQELLQITVCPSAIDILLN
uniref:Uncharacterized protein n=1 Tax=Trypanosoma congolense (strain IL3000) TaxID=1068625 RepID=G0UQ30_TRYCI|nr:conserved hypothetical protein [Trypanosoma congolense IL3000]